MKCGPRFHLDLASRTPASVTWRFVCLQTVLSLTVIQRLHEALFAQVEIALATAMKRGPRLHLDLALRTPAPVAWRLVGLQTVLSRAVAHRRNRRFRRTHGCLACDLRRLPDEATFTQVEVTLTTTVKCRPSLHFNLALRTPAPVAGRLVRLQAVLPRAVTHRRNYRF